MNDIDTSQLITQMRAMAAAAQGNTATPQHSITGSNFGDLLSNSINKVNEVQKASGKLTNSFISGDSSISLAEVMIAKQKSSIAFEAALQVRKKLVSAYKEIMSMQV
ncbi:MAG TPA: flagellar hook-basal body complex protein FliE [Gammaproteobacteria bacterium]|nr:flagellar hook-basal body complex protein FliE [Gammaproteobacteria bacterium]